jgi:CRP-like cAMP-binding protein
MRIMTKLGIAESSGTGIPCIFSAYNKFAVKPEIPTIDGGFIVRLPNMNSYVSQTKGIGVAFTSHEQKLLSVFQDVNFSKEDAADATGLSVSGAYKLLQRMRVQGTLAAYKSGKQWLYSVVDK